MPSEEREHRALISYLKSLNFHVLDAWVIECVNYYKSVNPGISLELLKNEVKQQWLLVNLRDLKVASLPPNLAASDKIILNGNYAVQVERMIDCSESGYSQFKKLRKITNEDIEPTEDSIKPKRCLTFDFCDGVQEVRGMEYAPIKKIKTNDPELLPGFKMIIKGPVECRKGMFLLKENNVTICGGEVDTLINSNNLRSILIEKLDLSESDIPVNENNDNVIHEHMPSVDDNDFGNHQPFPASEEIGNDNADALLSQNEDLFLNISVDPEPVPQEKHNNQSLQTETTSTSVSNSNTDVKMDVSYSLNEDDFNNLTVDNVFDDIFSTISKKHSLSQEDLFNPTPKKLSLDSGIKTNSFSPKTEVTTQDCVMDTDTDVIMIDDDDDFGASQKCQFKTLTQSKTKKPVQTKLSSFFKTNSLLDTSLSNSVVNEQLKQPVEVSHEPFVYLKQILSMNLNKPTVYTIKAIILTLKKKITMENDEFSLKANITDGSCSVDVDFSSNVVEDLLGFSPCEMAFMMKARQTNNAMADRIKVAFSKAKEKLISLNCLMHIKFFPEKSNPLVLLLEEITLQHLNALKERRLQER